MKILLVTLFNLLIIISNLYAIPNHLDLLNNKLNLEEVLDMNDNKINGINCLLQDSYGFMWIGTTNGLIKYDGYTFKPYVQESPDTTGFFSDNIKNIFEDNNGDIWIVTNKNLGKFNYYKQSFKNFSQLSDLNITSFCSGVSNTVWFGTENHGIIALDTNTDNYKAYPYNMDGGNIKISDILLKNKSTLFVVSSDMIFKFDTISRTYNLIPVKFPKKSHYKVFSKSYIGRDGCLWLGTFNGVYRLDEETLKLAHYKFTNTVGINVTSIFEFDNTIWVSSPFWLQKYDKFEDKFAQYASFNSLMWQIIIDKSGILWIATTKGLFKQIPETSGFSFFSIKKFEDIKPIAFEISSICDNSTDLWIGTLDGLIKLNRNNGEYQVFKNNLNDKYSIKTNWINEICQISRDELLILNNHKFFDILNLKTNKFIHNKSKFHINKKQYSIKSLYKEPLSNTIWYKSTNILYKLNKNNFELDKYYQNENNQADFDKWSHFYEDKNKNLWVYGNHDSKYFYKIEHGNKNLIEYELPNINKPNISSIFEDSTNKIWIGTRGNGLFSLESAKEKFVKFTSFNYISNIFGDRKNRVWLLAENDLYSYNYENKHLKKYNLNKIRGIECPCNLLLKNKKGEIFIGTDGGFVIFNPDNLAENMYSPQIIISDFKLSNRKLPLQILNNANSTLNFKDVKLSYDERNISISFSALDFTNPYENQYAYKLEGFDKDWKNTSARIRMATYTNLNPGEYTFRVKGSNSDGIWNENGASIKIIITPPFWKTWWAYLLYILIFISLIYLYIHYKTASQQKELQKKEEELKKEQEISERLRNIDRLKDEFLANTSHELRTPLNGIIGIADSLIDGIAGTLTGSVKSNLAMIVISGKRLASLVNDILDFSKLKNNELNLDKKTIDMYILSDFVLALSKSLAEKKGISLKNEISRDMFKVLGDENRLQQIMLNLVGNAIKFTEKGNMTVSAIEENGFIKISVKDTGIGVPEEKHEEIFKSFEQLDGSSTREKGGTGLGLSITKKLVNLHGGEIFLESKEGEGSVFSFTLPKSKGEAENKNALKELSKVKESIEYTAKSIVTKKDKKAFEFSILIVDDEEINQQVLENQLTLAHYRVTKVYNGKDALELINKGEKFDLILLDIMMPGLSGFEVAQKIRENYLPNELPIIMVTAKDRVSDLQEGLDVGANDYIAKPFSKEEMLSRVKTHLNLHKINSSYARFVPKEFLETLGKESIIDVKLGDQIQDEMTIVFSDIRSFTSISEKMTPKENFDFLNNYLSAVIPSIRKHNGFIDKYIGDAFMAIFPKKAVDALSASINVMEVLHKYNSKRISENQFPVNIGIGIHTGVSMLGTIGDETRIDGTVISDAVNFASRLEGLTKVYGASILISETTMENIENMDNYNYRFLGKVQVKGKNKAAGIYEIFDGDVEKQKELKEKTKIDFINALKAYFSKDFATAVVLFKQVLKRNPDDKAANLYLKNSANFVVNDVPDDWEGVEVMFSK